MASSGVEKKKSELEVVSVELPAPEGWLKKFTPKQGGTPRRNEVVFISPTGEEIKNRRQLDQFLRSHPGGPPSSSFDWGTGDTPRRSARISEKVKISPEAEKSKRAASSEKLKTSPEVERPKRAASREKVERASDAEKPKQASSSVLQKGTKRKENTEYTRDMAEEEDYADEEDGSKSGDAKGSEKGKRRKKTIKGEGPKAQGGGVSSEGDGPKDVNMEDPKDIKLTKSTVEIEALVEHESTEKTKGDVEESVELPIATEGAIGHKLADKAEENDGEKIEQDVEQSEGRGTKLESGKYFKEALNDTEVSPTAASDSEKVVLIETNGAPKDVDMEETEGTMHDKSKEEATSERVHGLVKDKSTDRTKKNIEVTVDQPVEGPDDIKHELAEKTRENDDMKGAKGTEDNKEEAAGEGVYGLVEHELADKTEENVLENEQKPAESQSAIKRESAVKIVENVEESVESHVDSQGEIKHGLADNAKENDVELAEGTEHKKSRAVTTNEEFNGLFELHSDDKTAIKHELAGRSKENVKEIVEQHIETRVDIKFELADKTNETDDEKVEQDLKQSEGKETELEPEQQVVDNLMADTDKVSLTQKDDEAPTTKLDEASFYIEEDAEALGNGNKDKEAKAAQKDKFEHLKQIKENPNDAEAFQPTSDSEKSVFIEQYVEVSATKNDEASVYIKESVTLSVNGGKAEEEAIGSLDDFLHDYDDENMQIDPSSSDW